MIKNFNYFDHSEQDFHIFITIEKNPSTDGTHKINNPLILSSLIYCHLNISTLTTIFSLFFFYFFHPAYRT